MGTNLIADVIAATTGGLFDFEVTASGTELLSVSPAVIIREHLSLEDLLDKPSDDAVWPCYLSFMPDDGVGVEDDCVALYDTSAVLDGRLMIGPYVQHYGLQLRVRSKDYQEGWAKINEISSNMDEIANQEVDYGGEQYLINSVSRMTAPVALGTEQETSRRFLFTTNFKAMIKTVE